MRKRLNKIEKKKEKKKFTYKALVVNLKKKLKTFYHFFQTSPLPDVFQVWKIARQISRLCTNLAVRTIGTVDSLDERRFPRKTHPQNGTSKVGLFWSSVIFFNSQFDVLRLNVVQMGWAVLDDFYPMFLRRPSMTWSRNSAY